MYTGGLTACGRTTDLPLYLFELSYTRLFVCLLFKMPKGRAGQCMFVFCTLNTMYYLFFLYLAALPQVACLYIYLFRSPFFLIY